MQRVLFVPIENNHVFNSTIPVDVSNFPDLPIIWEDEHGFSAYYLRNICQALQSGKWGKPIIQTDYALYSGFPRYKNFINNNGIFHQGFIFSEIANKKYIRSIDGSRILHVNYPLCDYSELHSGRDPIAGFNSGFFKILFFVNSYTQQLKCLIVDKNKSYYLIIPALFSELHNIEIQPNGIILYLSHWDQILAYLITPDGKVVSISQYNLITSFVCNQKPIYYSTVGQ